MAEAELTESVAVDLGLQEADAGVELGGDIDILVLHRQHAYEGRIVGGDVSDVGVFSVAELLVTIAADLGLGLDVSGSPSKLIHDVQH